jgi:hypothetical protein
VNAKTATGISNQIHHGCAGPIASVVCAIAFQTGNGSDSTAATKAISAVFLSIIPIVTDYF